MTGRIGASGRGRENHGEGGFTLIESIVAAAILLIIATAVVTTLVATSSWYAQARARTDATAVANQVMSLILSRNASDIRRPQQGETWPTAIPVNMTWPSANGTYSIDTSLVSQVDSATGLPVTEVVVTASPLTQVFTPPISASVIRFASGWQQQYQQSGTPTVTVQVQIQTDQADLAVSGARVQLLDPSSLTESYYAVTDGTGVATFPSVLQGQYFLTSDSRFGTDVLPLNFPQRVYPTRLGPSGQSSSPVVQYTLEVVQQSTPAILSVGAFNNDGFTSDAFPYQYGRWVWDIEKPYQPAKCLDGTYAWVYAQPVLNVAGSGSGIAGAGPTYPNESSLGPYAAQVDGYGIARIQVPWTIDPNVGQSWTVWYKTADGVKHTMTDYASGGWGTAINQIDLMSQGDRSKLPQFTNLVNAPIVKGP
jgi:prepilin-type N-terminal cleavage/methylation domain-containing protein